MAMVKRYWRAMSLLCSAALVTAGLYVHFSSGAAPPAVGVPPVPPPGVAGASGGSDASASAEAMAYLLEYDVLCGVRQTYCLTDEDLAAYGCDAAQATNLMAMLRQWYATSGPALAKANENFFAKRGELADVERRIGMGPRDERLFDRQAQIQNELFALQEPVRQIEQALREQIASLLSAQQQVPWQAAMTNGGLPLAYRYMPNLSEQDRVALHRWLRNEQLAAAAGREVDAMSANETIGRLIQAGKTEQTTRQALLAEKLPAIQAATVTVLPPPPVDPLTGMGAAGGGESTVANVTAETGTNRKGARA